MPENNNFSKMPDDDQVVWRYMSLSKFISIISKKELYFPSVKQLAESDKFEGLSHIPRHLLESNNPNLKAWDKMLLNSAKLIQEDTFERREDGRIFVNCWHMNTHECCAMWKIYSDSEGGVAIKTKFKNLMNTFDQFPIQARIVNYYSENSPVVLSDDPLYVPTNKRVEYKYEKELRLFYQSTSSGTQKGYPIGIDPKKLVQEVVLSPTSKPMFREVIVSLLQKYELLDCIVNDSRLAVGRVET
jgi:hypothetical protein